MSSPGEQQVHLIDLTSMGPDVNRNMLCPDVTLLK